MRSDVTEEQKERFAEALHRVAGDCELLSAMAAMVAEDAPEVLSDLRRYLEANEMQEVVATAHKLKGMLSTFETSGPVLELEELMVSARKNQMQEFTSSFNKLEGEIEKLIDQVFSLASKSV
jgi:HPt (histidine-containing phosphotransfer) domain-containing protein